MSGFGGFVPVLNNNNTVNQPAIRPGGVEPPRNGPVTDEPPQNVPAGNAGGAARTQDIVRSLDVLLARAGKAAGQAVDEAALAKLAKGAKFDKATVDSLRAAAKVANEAIARAEQLERDGKVYREKDWESDEVQDRILHAPFPLDPAAPVNGKVPTNQQGRKLVDDYKYIMAGNLYARDFGD